MQRFIVADVVCLGLVGWKVLVIEIETGKSDVVRTIRKCLDAGFDKVVVAILDKKLKAKVEDLLRPEEYRKVNFLCISKDRK